MTRIEINKHIVADPEICHGKLTFKGTRVMVWQVLELLAEGESYQKILKAFPSLRSPNISARRVNRLDGGAIFLFLFKTT